MVNSSIDLSEQISEARQDFKGKTTVAFIGDSYCGKTILCALLKDTASKYLPKETNEKYYGFATNGRQRINEFIYVMYLQIFLLILSMIYILNSLLKLHIFVQK